MRDDITRKYKHGADDNIVPDIQVISHIRCIRRKGRRICSS